MSDSLVLSALENRGKLFADKDDYNSDGVLCKQALRLASTPKKYMAKNIEKRTIVDDVNSTVQFIDKWSIVERDCSLEDWYKSFHAAPHDVQSMLYSYWEKEGHSGNTARFQIEMAFYIEEKNVELIYQAHHVFSPIAGCADLGCMHPRSFKELGVGND